MAAESVWGASVSEGAAVSSGGSSSVLVLVDTCVGGPCSAAAPASRSSAVGGKGSEPGSLTGQKAEPVGMKLTLFLSGHEKCGAEADADCLELSSKALTFSQPSGGSLLNM